NFFARTCRHDLARRARPPLRILPHPQKHGAGAQPLTRQCHSDWLVRPREGGAVTWESPGGSVLSATQAKVSAGAKSAGRAARRREITPRSASTTQATDRQSGPPIPTQQNPRHLRSLFLLHCPPPRIDVPAASRQTGKNRSFPEH